MNYTSNPEIVEKYLGRKPAENETELAAVAIDRDSLLLPD